MRISYGKIGRSWNLDPVRGTATGGDADVARALHILARRHPDWEFHLLGRNSGEYPQSVGYPDNVFNPWTELREQFKTETLGRVERMPSGQLTPKSIDNILAWHSRRTVPMFINAMDAQVLWLGQHGTSNTPTPMVDDRATLTNPQDAFTLYASFIIRGLNLWRDFNPDHEEIWLCPDPRNYMKARDIKWPLRNSIVAQFEQERKIKNERYGDPTPPKEWGATWDPKSDKSVWISPSRYTYDCLEMTAVPHPEVPSATRSFEDRTPFGILVNENRAYVSRDRLTIVREWVLNNFGRDIEIFGVWSPKSQQVLGRAINPVKYDQVANTMTRWKCTLTTPASGTGWATAKPWEAFKFGTVCFFHPEYDTQNHILKDAPIELQEWLRVRSAEQLKKRVEYLRDQQPVWQWIIDKQREHYVRRYYETHGGVAEIERRIENG